MTDYISRDELQKHLADCMTAEFFDSDMKKAVVGIDVYVENMPSADVQPVNQWISVKDSAPEAGVNVLVTDGIHMMVTWCEYVDNQCLWVDNYYEYVNVRFKEVTHWMPLPEFPKN